MAGDILDTLMKGISDLVPENDPFIKPIQLQGEVKKLQAKEDEIYREVGKKAMELDGEIRFRDELKKLMEVRRRRQAVQEKIYKIQAERNGKRKASTETQNTVNPEKEESAPVKQDEMKASTAQKWTSCSQCSCTNPPENRFCRECGAKLGAEEKQACPGCGNDVDKESKFCGKCGQKL